MRKKRIRKLKAPFLLEGEITRAELNFIVSQLGLTLEFTKNGSFVVNKNRDVVVGEDILTRAVGEMLVMGAHAWARQNQWNYNYL